MVDRDRAMLLLYDKGRWVGGRVLSKTGNWVEGEEYLQANSSSSSNIVIETNLVYKGNPHLTASGRIIYTNGSSGTCTTKIQVGFMNDSNAFTYISSTEGNASTSVKQSVVKPAIDSDGYYTNQKAISQTNRTASKGRKLCIRITTYFGVWRFDKIWLSGVSRL